jgi:hypothetical protein
MFGAAASASLKRRAWARQRSARARNQSGLGGGRQFTDHIARCGRRLGQRAAETLPQIINADRAAYRPFRDPFQIIGGESRRASSRLRSSIGAAHGTSELVNGLGVEALSSDRLG